MESPLKPAEIVLGALPLVLLLAALVVLPPARGPTYGFTDSGKKYRRVDPPEPRPLLSTRSFWIAYSICLAVAAGWALTEAVGAAVQKGLVSLPGQRNHPRPTAPWPAAWAYFTGLVSLLVASTLPWLLSKARFRATSKLVAVLCFVLGNFFVLLSPALTSLRGAALVAAVVALVVVCVVLWLVRSAHR